MKNGDFMPEITNDMTKQFNESNKSSTEIDPSTKQDIKKKYLEFIGVDENYRDKDYDVDLVGVSNYGSIDDNNHISNIVKNAAILWGIVVGVIVVLYAVMSFLSPSMFLSIFMLLAILGILILVCIAIGEFIGKITSSRDSKYKLAGSLFILPIVIVLLILLYSVGVIGTALLIFVFLVLAALGAFFLFLMK